MVVWLQKKSGCSLNCSLKICQQNASCFLILIIRCSKLGLTTCSVDMQDRSNNIWLYQHFLPLLERACRVLLISILSILFNKNYLDINYDKVRVNHPIQKGGKSFKHANHMLVLKLLRKKSLIISMSVDFFPPHNKYTWSCSSGSYSWGKYDLNSL